MHDPIIEIRDLVKRFGTGDGAVTALDGISLTIRQGDIFGIIGLSGAGKSTLVRCINLLERPTAGTVTVSGQQMTDLSEKDLRQARRSIGMIFQGFNLLMQRTARDNICFPLELTGVSRQIARKRADELLEVVGLTDRADSYPSQLSGGQKQRVAIARAVANNPKVLLCDEATSALDPNTTRSILDLLKNINQTMGVTIVIITHEMRVIEQICNQVAVIDQSHIVELGTVTDVFTHPKSTIARQLILSPDTAEASETPGPLLPFPDLDGVRVVRLVFHGGSAYEPLVASLAIDCGVKGNILGADTRNIEGKAYGSMLIGLPQDPVQSEKALAYLRAQPGVTAEEVSDHA